MDIVSLDQDVTLAINSFHCGFSDSVWKIFSNKDVWIPLYAVIAVLLVWRLGWKKAMVYILSVVLCIVVTDQFSNVVKDYVCRLRPCYEPSVLSRGLRLLEGAGGQYGFFSAHAANAFGLAVCSSQALKSDGRGHGLYSWLIFVWAALVSISRVFVGKHYMGDVLVGVISGLLIGYLMVLLAGKVVDAIDK